METEIKTKTKTKTQPNPKTVTAHRSGEHKIILNEERLRALLDVDAIQLLASRLARMYILHQFVEADHPVLKEEEALLRTSRAKMREMIGQFVPTTYEWDEVSSPLGEMVRAEAKKRILEEEMDEDLEVKALEELEAWKPVLLHPKAREN